MYRRSHVREDAAMRALGRFIAGAGAGPWAAFGALFVVLAATASDSGFDHAYWIAWSEKLHARGLARIYDDGDVNYLPVFLYFLRGLRLAAGAAIGADRGHVFKLVPLAFDLLTSGVLAAWLARRGLSPWRGLLVALNLGLVYNSWVWGQVDSIHSFFVMTALLSALEGLPALSAALLVLALNTKLQSLPCVPFAGFLLLASVGRRWRTWGRVALSAAGTQLLLVLPFALEGRLDDLVRTAFGLVDFYARVSMNAFNHWYFFVEAPLVTSDTLKVLGLSYKRWGLALLLVNGVAIAVPFCRAVMAHARHGPLPGIERIVLLAAALAGTAFFYFPTQMHERYLHAAVLLLGVEAALSGRWGAYAATSLAYLLNLEAVNAVVGWPAPREALLRPAPLAAVIGVAYAYGLYRLYALARYATQYHSDQNVMSTACVATATIR
jgi:Gpi18-like mannosyltransferase